LSRPSRAVLRAVGLRLLPKIAHGLGASLEFAARRRNSHELFYYRA